MVAQLIEREVVWKDTTGLWFDQCNIVLPLPKENSIGEITSCNVATQNFAGIEMGFVDIIVSYDIAGQKTLKLCPRIRSNDDVMHFLNLEYLTLRSNSIRQAIGHAHNILDQRLE